MDIANQPKREKAKLWRIAEYHDLELLSATYFKQKFSHHFHDTYSIGIVESGAGEFYHRGKTRRVDAGLIFIINPNEVHGGHPASDHGWKYRMFYPGVPLMSQIATDVSGSKWTYPFFEGSIIDDPIVARQLLYLHRVLETTDNRLKRDTAMRVALGALILRHAEDKPEPCCSATERQAVKQVREYLEANYEQNTSLDELSDIAGLSPYHLVRVFKQETGLPPHTYLTHIRVQQAREMLKNDPLSIADVAYATGFTDQSHLTRWFKRMVGVTPGKYATV